MRQVSIRAACRHLGLLVDGFQLPLGWGWVEGEAIRLWTRKRRAAPGWRPRRA